MKNGLKLAVMAAALLAPGFARADDSAGPIPPAAEAVRDARGERTADAYIQKLAGAGILMPLSEGLWGPGRYELSSDWLPLAAKVMAYEGFDLERYSRPACAHCSKLALDPIALGHWVAVSSEAFWKISQEGWRPITEKEQAVGAALGPLPAAERPVAMAKHLYVSKKVYIAIQRAK